MTWPTKKLGEVCEIISPGIKKFKGSKKYIATADVDFDEIINFTEITYNNRPSRANIETKENDVLVARMAETKKFLIVDKKLQDDYIFSTGFAVLRTKKDLFPKCLFYFLTTKDFNLQKNKLAVGATQKAINNPALKRVKITLPPLKIQKQIVERLDKIIVAQKLNDELIKKADELFQSLLHKELNPAGKNWKEDKFVNCIEKNPLKIKGIPREKYQSTGKFPIIDQSDKFIVGYTDNEDKVYKIDSSVIIFGDHTRIFKYIDFNFAIGADGTQIIIPDRKIIIPKFFYFLMLNLKINNLGYSRHFKILKTKKLIIPPLVIQKQIVEKLSAAQEYKNQLLTQKSKLKELFDSVLAKSIKW